MGIPNFKNFIKPSRTCKQNTQYLDYAYNNEKFFNNYEQYFITFKYWAHLPKFFSGASITADFNKTEQRSFPLINLHFKKNVYFGHKW